MSYRQIHSKIWKDPWFLDLPSDEKLVFIYLFSNDRVNVIGIYDVSIKTLAHETDIDKGRIEEILTRFEDDGKVVRDGNWIWVVNLFTHNAMNLGSPKIQAHIRGIIPDIGSTVLRDKWFDKYRIELERYGIHTVSIPIRTDTDTHTDTDTETETNAADAARPAGRTFQEWHNEIQTSKNRHAALVTMFTALYPTHDPPDFGRIGTTAKRVGGAGRLAELLWQHSTKPPTGNVLDYIEGAVSKNGKNGGNGHGKNGSIDDGFTSDETRARLERLRKERKGQPAPG